MTMSIKKTLGRLAAVALVASTMTGITPGAAQAQDALIGETRLFGFNFCPRFWQPADGRLLAISQNTALFSILGTSFGGDGRTTFALPDLRGRAPVAVGHGPGLSLYTLGQKSGAEFVNLTELQIPAHTHRALAANAAGNQESPSGHVPANSMAVSSGFPPKIYASDTTADVNLPASTVAITGASVAHENRPPYLVMNWCVATEGIYPSRS